MINSSKETKNINSFEYVSIPSPRDVFRKYGERIGNEGLYTSTAESSGIPQIVSSSSVIDQMINAQTMLSNECESSK